MSTMDSGGDFSAPRLGPWDTIEDGVRVYRPPTQVSRAFLGPPPVMTDERYMEVLDYWGLHACPHVWTMMGLYGDGPREGWYGARYRCHNCGGEVRTYGDPYEEGSQ